MSVGSVSGSGIFRCKNLVLDGQTIVPSAIGGTTLVVGSGAPQSGAITLAGGVTQSGSTFTFSGGAPATGTMTTPNYAEATNPNQWVAGDYAVGAVVYSAIAPYNWFVCYTAVPGTGAPSTTDPQTDVNAGLGGIGTYWMLLAYATPGSGGGSTVPTLWSNTSAYAVGAVVNVGNLNTPTGTFICITAVPAGSAGSPNTTPSGATGSWTPLAPLAGGSGVVSIATPSSGATPLTGAITFAGAGVSSAGSTITFAGGSGGTTVPTLWSNSSAYAVGAVVSVGSLGGPTGTFICILAVTAPVSPATNNPPQNDNTHWTPVAPLAGITTLTGTGGTPTAANSVAFTSSVTSGASTALSFVPSASGMVLTGTVGGTASGVSGMTGGGATPTPATGAVAFTSTVTSGASTALTWTSTASGMELGGTVGGSAGISPVAYGTITVPATPGSLINCYIPGTTPPAAPAVALTVRGGTLPATFTANTFWTVNATVGGSATAPGGAQLCAPNLGSSQAYVAIGPGSGSLTAGQIINWVLWVA